MVQCGQEQPDDRGIDAAQHRLKARLGPQEVPQRQAADDQQKGGQKNCAQSERRPRPAVGSGVHHRPQVGREGEQGTGDGLRRAVASDELLVGDPAWRYHLRLDQRQHHVTTAED